MPKIRLAAKADLEAVVALALALTREENRRQKAVRLTRETRRWVAAHQAALVSHRQVLVAEAEGAVVGFACLVTDVPKLDVAYLSATIAQCYVLPAHRGRGLGAALMKKAAATAKRRGVHAVTLHVSASNRRAEALYRRLGFVPLATKMILPLDPEYCEAPRA